MAAAEQRTNSSSAFALMTERASERAGGREKGKETRGGALTYLNRWTPALTFGGLDLD